MLVAAYTRSPHGLRRVAVRLSTPGYRVGVVAVLRRPDGRVLLVDQPYVEGWSLPGGDLHRGEAVREGLGRELREELGVDLDPGTPVLAHQRTHDRWVTFVAVVELTDEQAGQVAARSAELTAVGWFDPQALPPVHADAAVPIRLALAAAAVDPEAT